MRGQTAKALLFVALLSLLAADISVGCGSKAYVYGPVTQKFNTGAVQEEHMILINGDTYTVPIGFFEHVQVGDTVKFNGREWSIVKKAGTP